PPPPGACSPAPAQRCRAAAPPGPRALPPVECDAPAGPKGVAHAPPPAASASPRPTAPPRPTASTATPPSVPSPFMAEKEDIIAGRLREDRIAALRQKRGEGLTGDRPRMYLADRLLNRTVHREMSPDRLDATFAALADPTRRAILARLASGE